MCVCVCVYEGTCVRMCMREGVCEGVHVRVCVGYVWRCVCKGV